MKSFFHLKLQCAAIVVVDGLVIVYHTLLINPGIYTPVYKGWLYVFEPVCMAPPLLLASDIVMG